MLTTCADYPIAKLQTEVRRLQRDLQNQQRHRLELSEEILQEARTQLQTLQTTVSQFCHDLLKCVSDSHSVRTTTSGGRRRGYQGP
jgi:hypothetical protein